MNNYSFSILLSASVPSKKRSEKYQENYTKIKDAQIQIEEAVIGLSRNIFQAGGKMIFGGHPSISPLVAMVATEYKINMEIENIERSVKEGKAISIFQSRAFEKVIPEETTSLFELGYSEILWTDAAANEEFNPANPTGANEQCKESLLIMRQRMMSGEVDALVCIGGMEGVEDEFDLFIKLKPGNPVFILQSTGGASKILAEKFSDYEFVRVVDDENRFPLKNGINKDGNSTERFNIIPYSFITALIVNEVNGKNNR